MSKFSRATMGGLLFAFWFMCFVFPVSLIMSFSDHTPIGQFLVNMVVDFFVLWFICGMVAHAVIGMFDDINKPRSDDRNPDGTPKNLDGPEGRDATSDKKDEQGKNDGTK